MHGERNWASLEDDTAPAITYHEELDIELTKQHNKKPPVVMESRKHVKFFVVLGTDLSAIDLIKPVHQEECLKEESVVHKSVGGSAILSKFS